MIKLRWIHLLLALGLVAAFAIAARPTVTASAALAQPKTLSGQDVQLAAGQCMLTTTELHSLHGTSLPGQSIRIMETVDGPLGYEGGYSALSRCR